VRRSVLALAAAVLLAGCGAGGDAGPALQQTANKLDSIKSGVLTFAVDVQPRDGEPFGFSLEGPFALAQQGQLPELDIAYTQTANGKSATIRLVSDGEQAVAISEGKRIELAPEALEQLRATGAGEGGGLAQLRIDRWLVDPELSDGPDGTDRITGELDVAEVANGLLAFAASFGRGAGEPLSEADAERLRDAIDSAEFEILTGKEDRLLRKLSFDVALGVDVPEALRDAFGDVVGADVAFLLELAEPNKPVEVTLP
jgi:hypothetical protein